MRLCPAGPSPHRSLSVPSKVCLEHPVDSLRELRSADSTFRQVDLCLGQRRLLHRQPWRRPARTAPEPSLLARIRRFEACARRH